MIFVAEINGRVNSGGTEVAMNMENQLVGRQARFRIPKSAGGVLHGGGFRQLVRLSGPGLAMEHLLTAHS